MGQFSWICSDDNRPLYNEGNDREAYLLLPTGGSIHEREYEGYGIFDGQDVYELVVDWNLPALKREDVYGSIATLLPKETIDKIFDAAESGTLNTLDEELGKNWKRDFGIHISCYDEDNEKLPYPIKITRVERAYDSVKPSKADPDQGWHTGEEEEEY